MIPWELVGCAPVPEGGEELRLYRRGGEFSIRVGDRELMNSRLHGSEEALAELACGRISDRSRSHVLIGGLGMGYTVAAALRRLGADARVVIAEIVPAVVAWNHGPLAELAGRPLEDPRVALREEDAARVLLADRGAYDAILLDVDNGPEGLTRKGNDWLYSPAGLNAALDALRPAGVLAVWSAGPDRIFAERLRRVGFELEEIRLRARGSAGGRRHTIWLGRRP
jgi:spermidine synthase